MNIIKYDENSLKCPLCDSEFLIKDHFRSEIFCGKCGLVVFDNSLISPSKIEFMSSIDEENY